MLVMIVGGILLAPAIALLGAVVRGTILFWPTMILLGAVHSFLPWVPALGWFQTFLVISLLSILIPGGSTFNSEED